jgi:hypothetical protein
VLAAVLAALWLLLRPLVAAAHCGP